MVHEEQKIENHERVWYDPGGLDKYTRRFQHGPLGCLDQFTAGRWSMGPLPGKTRNSGLSTYQYAPRV